MLLRVILLAAALVGFLYWQNNGLTVSRYEYASAEVAESFDGYRIVQLSDLQDKCFGKDQAPLLERVAALEPDIILLTGDMVDYNRFHMEPTLALLRGAVQLAPCYFITGNHEAAFKQPQKREIINAIADCGVTVLDDEYVRIERGEDGFFLFGLSEYEDLPAAWYYGMPKEEGLCVMMAHRPERFDSYLKGNEDLIFSGHAHGGQIRLPFVGGLYSTGQGWFPRLTSGVHERDGVTMVINRGLGNSTFPQRIFNRPEIVLLTLRSGEK